MDSNSFKAATLPGGAARVRSTTVLMGPKSQSEQLPQAPPTALTWKNTAVSTPSYIGLNSVVEQKDKAGWLEKQGHVVRNWKERYFTLEVKEKQLKYYTTKDSRKPKGTILLENFTLEAEPSYHNAFTVQASLPKPKVFVFRCRTSVEKAEWMSLLSTFKSATNRSKIEGFLGKKSGEGSRWLDRWCILDLAEKYLDYYDGTTKKGCLDLNLMKSYYVVNTDSKFIFAIEVARKCYQFSCRTAQERDRWMEALSILSADRNVLETQILDFFTSQIDGKNEKRISLEQTMSFFIVNNIRPPAAIIQRLFEKKIEGTGYSKIDVREFEDLVKRVMTRTDVIDIFSKIAQQEPIPWSSFKSWFDNNQPNSRDPKETFKDLDVTWKGDAVTLKHFEDYIFSPVHNSIFVKKQDDMTQDITKYYIATSYSSGGSEDGVNEYKDILMKGCRCIELDCSEGPKGTPKLPYGDCLQEALNCIKTFAFSAFLKDPVIVCLLINCSEIQQDALALMIIRTFENMLLNASNDQPLPTLDKLQNKILLKIASNSPSTRLSNRLLSIAHFKEICPKFPLQATGNSREIASLEETKLSDLLRYRADVKRFTDQQLLLVQPHPLARSNTSNTNPVQFWSVGAQLFALNYHSNDLALRLQYEFFGGRGYVLKKPDSERKITLTLSPLSGMKLPTPPNGESLNCFITMSVFGDEAEQSNTTKTIEDNAWNPRWDSQHHFVIYESSSYQMLNIQLFHKRTTGARGTLLLGYFCCHVSDLRAGIRCVQLKDPETHQPFPPGEGLLLFSTSFSSLD